MPLTILKFSSIEEMLGFIDTCSTSITDSHITYVKLTIAASFSMEDVELAKSYGAVVLLN